MCVIYTVWTLAVYVGFVVSNHTDLFVNPELKQAAAVLESLCSNFVECGIDITMATGQKCCIQCSCEPSCTRLHSCCPESGYHPMDVVPYPSVLDGMVCRNGEKHGKPQGIFRHPEYLFLERCPIGTESDLKYKCEETHSSNNVSLLGSLPLYDSLQGINYANTYCAMCNNASNENLVTWEPLLSCKNDIDISAATPSKIEEWVSADVCSLVYNSPDLDVSDTLCYNDVVTSCNVTGNWASYDAELESYCNLLDILYVSIEIGRQTYRNIFCAYCNGENLAIPSYPYCPFGDDLQFSMSFMTILQFSLGDIDQYTGNEGEAVANADGCFGNFAFDPIMRRCKPVYCSTPNILTFPTLQCKPLFGYTNKVSAGYTFFARFREAVTFSIAQDNALEIYDLIRETGFRFCTISGTFETSFTAVASLDDVVLNATSEVIAGVYVSVAYTILQGVPGKATSIIRGAIESTITNKTTNDYFGPETFDPGMILLIGYENLNTIKYMHDVAVFKLMGPSHYLFKNPYNERLLIGERNSWHWSCKVNLFANDYLACPSFRYNITKFTKTPSGLRLAINDSFADFGFDEFKTANPNATDVNICCQAVIDKVTPLVARQSANSADSPTPFVVGVVLTLYQTIYFGPF